MATLVTLGLSKILGKVGEPTALNFTETGYTAFGLTYEQYFVKFHAASAANPNISFTIS